GEIYIDVAAVDLPRESDIGASRDRRVIEEGRERPSRLQRRCRETSEKSRDPEADAAFIGDSWLCPKRQGAGQYNSKRRPQRNTHRNPPVPFDLAKNPVNATATTAREKSSMSKLCS